MKIKKTFTVTVAISAYNEEKNIKKFIHSVLKQKEEGFTLQKILIYSDGSNDKTVQKVKSIKSRKIKIIACEERMGKSTRLNQIYSEVKTDFLIQSDADVVFAQPYVIRDIIQPLIEDKQVGMCGGNPIPLEGITFIEKADSVTFKIYMTILKNMNGGNNVFSADGRILAYRKELYKRMNIPEDMIANDVYTYYVCITNYFKYKFVSSAQVDFRSPQILQDKIKQTTRASAVRLRMQKYFPPELVNKEMYIPASVHLRSILLQFIRYPIASLLIFFVSKYCSFKAVKAEKYLNAKWDIACTTKNL